MKTNFEKVKNAMLSVQRYPWEQGVCMQAMYEAGEYDIMVAMAHDAVLRQKEDGRLAVINENIAVTDPAANGIGVIEAYNITHDKFYLEGASRMFSYLMEKAPRTDKGILCHNEVSFHEGFSEKQIWADSIFMAPPFIAKMGEIDQAYFQLKGMYDYLIDENAGLLRHIYDAGKDAYVRNKLWATGNAWALMGMAAVSDISIEAGRDDVAKSVNQLSKSILDSMLRYQTEDGRFHDILDDMESFIDGTSAMMMATYIYRGVFRGYLDKSYLIYAKKVMLTMEKYVDEYGIIHGVCGCPNFVSEGTSAESMAAYIMMHSWEKECISK